MVWPIGKIGAPKAPCMTRSASSVSSELARPHSIEARVKPATETTINVRQPSRAASQLVSGVVIAVATRLKVRTQEIWSCVADSAPLSCGRITVTLVAVRPNRMVVNCTDSRISHCRAVIAMPAMLWSPPGAGKHAATMRNRDLRSDTGTGYGRSREGETHEGTFKGTPRDTGQGRDLDSDRRAEPPRAQEHDPVRRPAGARRAAADGRHRLHDALHSLARGHGRA